MIKSNIRFSIIVIIMVSLTSMALADAAFKFGNEKGQVAFINHNNHPELQEPLPLGPLSFRVIDGYFYILDSVGGKIIKTNKDASKLAELVLTATPSEMLFDDFAPAVDAQGNLSAFWIIEALTNSLIKVDLKGKICDRLSCDDFIQPFRIETSPNGSIFVADKGAKAILVFDQNKNLLHVINWEWSGMGVSNSLEYGELLYRLCYASESNSSYLVAVDSKNKVVFEKELELENHFNAELWWVDEGKQEFVMTFAKEKKGNQVMKIARVGFDGKLKSEKDLSLPYAMNRYIAQTGSEIYIGVGDFGKAPAGEFKIEKMKLP